ncbi:hypothetical protein TWF730_010178 [Orbilia blumenaviensis]|uniref:Peptidase S8/S53 domain-containing protein n=1 Tax=Orbilia blumenaviensis TaxID=1796055 RepID=A0AAV9UR11_9PEZI
MSVAYAIGGIVLVGVISPFCQKRSYRPSVSVSRSIKPRSAPSARPLRPEPSKLLRLEHLDYTRGDHSDKIDYWDLYRRNCIEPFKPRTELDLEFQINVLLIDSGIDGDHVGIMLQIEDGIIRPWRDYTTAEDPMLIDERSDHSGSLVDEFGHGTCGADIIGMMASSAIIYSARVSKNGSKVSPKVVAKAINDAVDATEENEVSFDFIVMPLGFPENSKGLEELEAAIKRAGKLGITLIAAAGNDGNFRNPPPPACYPEVICAFSCDGNGTPSGFSPSIHLTSTEKKEFLVPGEGIECAWIEPGKCHSQERRIYKENKSKFAPTHEAHPSLFQGLGHHMNLKHMDQALPSDQNEPEEKSGYAFVSGTSFACSVLAGISIVVLERLYEVAVKKDYLSAIEEVDNARKKYLRDILSRMTRPERGAYLLNPTQITNEILSEYLTQCDS